MPTRLPVSLDTERFEVAARLDARGHLEADAVRRAIESLDEHGFVLLTDVLSADEAQAGLDLVKSEIAKPDRERAEFASQIDIKYGRRDFCPLPSTEPVLALTTTLCGRLQGVLGEYCGRSRRVLEISTLTSYLGSSHQYIHRDPDGVLCAFAALDDVSPEQGGTVFVPGTHKYSGADLALDGRYMTLAKLKEIGWNARILKYNLQNLFHLREEAGISDQELRWRAFSHHHDNHQPNIVNFLLARTGVFNVKHLNPATLYGLVRHRKALDEHFELVQVAPKKGSVILYRSDMLHAGPDNRSQKPRYFFALSIARDVIHEDEWRDGYSPHSTLLADPKSLGDFLDRANAQAAASSAPAAE